MEGLSCLMKQQKIWQFDRLIGKSKNMREYRAYPDSGRYTQPFNTKSAKKTSTDVKFISETRTNQEAEFMQPLGKKYAPLSIVLHNFLVTLLRLDS